MHRTGQNLVVLPAGWLDQMEIMQTQLQLKLKLKLKLSLAITRIFCFHMKGEHSFKKLSGYLELMLTLQNLIELQDFLPFIKIRAIGHPCVDLCSSVNS